MQEIKYIEPAALHDEMARLRNERKMDFLTGENLPKTMHRILFVAWGWYII